MSADCSNYHAFPAYDMISPQVEQVDKNRHEKDGKRHAQL